MEYNVHGKILPVPSFFQVYNYGGGNGDKDREIVYAELTEDTPALINYYYINNKIPHLFQSRFFDDLSGYKKIGDVYNHIREALIKRGEIYSGYKSPAYDFNTKVFLLDSGAFNIVKYLADNVDYNYEKFKQLLLRQMKDYYDFAERLKIDIVTAFDLGGKYTEKDGEKSNDRLMTFLREIDSNEINNMLLRETVRYLSDKKEYYPLVLATVHGQTQEEYRKCTEYILELEKKYDYRFWGFALGGVASYRQLDDSWYSDIDFGRIGKRGFISAVAPARAARAVRSVAGCDRAIHALGCGGYPNIVPGYFCGITSFDAASPVRRVGDGNLESTRQVFKMRPSAAAKFSKYFVGGINADGTLRPEECEYVKLYQVNDDMKLCGCPVCRAAKNVHNIKTLYSMKEKDSEATYFSRQLMGLHAVWQHRKLCETVAKHENIEEFYKAYPNKLNKGLAEIFKQLLR